MWSGPRLLLLALLLGQIPSAVAGSKPPPWPGFQTIIWQTKTAHQYQALKILGVTGAMVQADRARETPASARRKVSPIIQAGLRPYVENIATDFYSAYHRWFPDRPVNASFLAVQRAIAENPGDRSAFIRRPSLSDPTALALIQKRITALVRTYSLYRPLFFNLGDEAGIADLSAAWDFDFSSWSLSSMRQWLKGEYGTLAALNREWGTHFDAWQEVIPPTTTETMMRTDGNYAAWSDFKAWMDMAFAMAIEAGTQAVHAGAPWARAGIEGAQMPGWGGYDYIRLAPAVDVMELYDAGQSLDFAQAFNRQLAPLMTINWSAPDALHRAWRGFLRGMRGMILWDPKDRLVNSDGSLGPDGPVAASFLADIRRDPAALISASRRVRAPIAVLYSPESYRLQWLLDHRTMGTSWTRLGSDDQNANNAVRAARQRVLGLLDRLGVSPHFVSDRQIASGLLDRMHDRIVILPQALSISAKASDAIRAFVGSGGILISEGQTGLYDGHGRRLALPQFSGLLDGTNPRAVYLSSDDKIAIHQFTQTLQSAGITPEVHVEASVGIERYLYRNGPLTILALLAEPAEGPGKNSATAILSLAQPSYVYDLRAKRLLRYAKQISVAVDSSAAALLAISTAPISGEMCQSILRWQRCPSAPEETVQ